MHTMYGAPTALLYQPVTSFIINDMSIIIISNKYECTIDQKPIPSAYSEQGRHTCSAG